MEAVEHIPLEILQAFRNNGMQVFLPPQINGMCDTADSSNSGKYHVVQSLLGAFDSANVD